MTNLTERLEAILSALDDDNIPDAVAYARAALAAAREQQPVAWIIEDADFRQLSFDPAFREGAVRTIPLYAAPPAQDAEDAARRLADVREIYAGMEGFVPQTAAEGYCLEIIRKMAHAALAAREQPCTCHPDDNPPQPCPKKYALSECRAAAREQQPVACPFGCTTQEEHEAHYAAPPAQDAEDAARLAALERLASEMVSINAPGSHGGSADKWLVTVERREGDSYGPLCDEYEADTFRAAIDAARGSEQCESNL